MPIHRTLGRSLLFLALVLGISACDRGRDQGQVSIVEREAGADASAPTRPRSWPVIVSIVIDQEAAWIADERWPLLPADGGFARLRREGTYAKDMRYAHAATDTAPGHAALYTGAPPRVSGIWSNEVFDATTNDKVSIVRDRTARVLPSPSDNALPGASMGPLKVDTIADRFRTAYHDALILSISLKDRGAVFAGGRAATAVLWYDKELDRFVTSDLLGGSFPAWAQPLAVPSQVRAQPWTLLDADWVRSHAATPDAENGEGELGGMPITFPHDVANAKSVPVAFRGSPFADDAIFGLAIAGLAANHAAERPTFLALSLSANDYIGHTFGPDSWEAWDELRRLDASLGRFLAQLDARFGAGNWSLILSADHGVTTMPEAAAFPQARPWCAKGADASADRWGRACGKVARLMPDAIAKELREEAARAFPNEKEPLVLGLIDPYVYLTAAGRALAPADLEKLEKVLTAALLRHPEIDRVIDTSTLPETCPADTDESVEALVCRSFVPKKAGELYVLAKRGSFFDPGVVAGKGSSHGSVYLFDRSVPLLVRAPGRAKPGVVLNDPISFRSFNRTLATLLGVEPPNFEAARALDLANAKDP